MDTRKLTAGSRIDCGRDGFGTVTFVGADYLGVRYDSGNEVLIRRDALDAQDGHDSMSADDDHSVAGGPALAWPESTFAQEPTDTPHYLGSHWEPFADGASEIMKQLPDILSRALPQTGYGDNFKAPRTVPEDWPKGIELAWPLRTQGLALILKLEPDSSSIVSFFPFFANGSQHALTLRAVSVWEGGLEAQITATWGDANICFFDSQFIINRGWYATGTSYDFILSGIAYSAGPAERREWTINRHPDEVSWSNRRLAEGEEPHEAEYTMTLDGAAVFMTVEGWDTDDHSFHAPVKSVREFRDWLGQDGWRVRATVMRFGDEDADLDILITRRIWRGTEPPQIGQDIEGQLWLQGYLWKP